MTVATSGEPLEVGVRDLKNNLSRYLERVRAGDQVVVTDHGRPVARLTPMDPGVDRLAELVASGVVRAPKDATRHRPARRVRAKATVSDLVHEQRG
ncbi:MAG: type II toxin-antitoxin system prevent-host-death family antitoxin [Actinomycetota bacterium]|nr:type II toxin-antitoxin system prevent-host-death family antitoxin [Actinomycetota bacterium]